MKRAWETSSSWQNADFYVERDTPWMPAQLSSKKIMPNSTQLDTGCQKHCVYIGVFFTASDLCTHVLSYTVYVNKG